MLYISTKYNILYISHIYLFINALISNSFIKTISFNTNSNCFYIFQLELYVHLNFVLST